MHQYILIKRKYLKFLSVKNNLKLDLYHTNYKQKCRFDSEMTSGYVNSKNINKMYLKSCAKKRKMKNTISILKKF